MNGRPIRVEYNWGINNGGVIPTGRYYYRWNGGWGYMRFYDLQMYYVHGRWYDPFIGRFISPNEKGDYLYGGDGPCEDDAVNCALALLQGVLTKLQVLKSQAYYLACGNTIIPSPICRMQFATSPSDLVKEVNRLYRGEVTFGPPIDPETIKAVEMAASAAEKLRLVREVLPSGTEKFPIPEGWEVRPTDKENGWVFQKPGSTGDANSIRIMYPGADPRYPDGYVRYYNQYGQPLDVNGKPGSKDETHIPLDYPGDIPGWPK